MGEWHNIQLTMNTFHLYIDRKRFFTKKIVRDVCEIFDWPIKTYFHSSYRTHRKYFAQWANSHRVSSVVNSFSFPSLYTLRLFRRRRNRKSLADPLHSSVDVVSLSYFMYEYIFLRIYSVTNITFFKKRF